MTDFKKEEDKIDTQRFSLILTQQLRPGAAISWRTYLIIEPSPHSPMKEITLGGYRKRDRPDRRAVDFLRRSKTYFNKLI